MFFYFNEFDFWSVLCSLLKNIISLNYIKEVNLNISAQYYSVYGT